MFSWPLGELPSLEANEIRPAGRLYVCTRGRALRLPGSGLLAPAPHGRSLRAQSKARSFRIKHAEARSEEHTSELQSLMRNSYAVFCLKKNNTITLQTLN